MQTPINKGVERLVLDLSDLPALPSVVSEVMSLTEVPNVSMERIGAQIEKDPVLTAKILKVSNSPYYGMRRFIGTLKLALVVLGVREVRNIVLGVSVFDAVDDKSLNRVVREAFWAHATLVGGIARHIAVDVVAGLQGEEFVSGLLHDMGKMVMWRQMGEPYLSLMSAFGDNPAQMQQKELALFGYDHADVAAALSFHWNLPRTLADAVYYHHERTDGVLADAKDPRLAALIRMADQLAHEMKTLADAEDSAVCRNDEIWQILLPNDPRAKDYASRKTLMVSILESINESSVFF